MPFKSKLATGQKPVKKTQSGAVKKRKPASAQRTTRSRAARSSNTPTISPIPLKCYQDRSTTSPRPTKRQKRKYVPEDDPPGKLLPIDRKVMSDSGQDLTKANLERFDRVTDLGASDEMDPVATGSFSSQPSSSTDIRQETPSVHSQRSSYTAANYRRVTLEATNIFIQPECLPDGLRARINAVTQRSISEERKHELSLIAQNLCKGFVEIFRTASSEDDCVWPIRHALSAMDSNTKFAFPRKADWDPSLKPSAPPGISFDFTFLMKSNDKVGDSVTGPRKEPRIQGDTPCPPPLSLPLPQSKPPMLVKTPRPDFTIGLRESTVFGALATLGLDKDVASDLLTNLQRQQILCSDPSPLPLAIRFPFMVVEGKSYAAGRTFFEAQNQAAVSGSCMTNIQHELADLTERTSPESYHSKLPLAFSICTEGPHMELWVHYTTSHNGTRSYNMSILKTCHASLQEEVTEFFIMVDSVMNWAGDDFLEEIAQQLGLIYGAHQVQPAV